MYPSNIWSMSPFLLWFERKLDNLDLSDSSSTPSLQIERGDNELFIILVPKVLKYCFLIRWPNNFGDYNEFWLLGSLTFQSLILIYRRVILCILIRNVHQFIGHCLIPLDPCLLYDKCFILHCRAFAFNKTNLWHDFYVCCF